MSGLKNILLGAACAFNFAVVPASAQLNAAAATQASAGNPAESFVQENIDKGYAILRDAHISEDARHAQFREFFLGLIDSRRIGLFTLGQYANGASKADIDAFTSAFVEYNEALYEARLTKYKDQVLKVKGSVARAPGDVVVNCEGTDPSNPAGVPYKIAFRVRGADGHSVVTDMSVEDIWQTITQRADTAGFLAQHGGRIAELTNELNRAADTIEHGERTGPNSNGLRLDLPRSLFKP
jgi:phospholipid transport system substrate-binding protein